MEIRDYQEAIFEVLQNNKNRKVNSVIPLIAEIPLPTIGTKPKRKTTFLLDSDREVFAIFCYYHKQWELVSETEYGTKNGTKTGLNTMCKAGVRHWTKQHKDAKNANEDLLNKLMAGDVTQIEAQEQQALIEQEKTRITYDEKHAGYTEEEINDLLRAHNKTLED